MSGRGRARGARATGWVGATWVGLCPPVDEPWEPRGRCQWTVAALHRGHLRRALVQAHGCPAPAAPRSEPLFAPATSRVGVKRDADTVLLCRCRCVVCCSGVDPNEGYWLERVKRVNSDKCGSHAFAPSPRFARG